ncbi:MAG: hypothetical protein ABIF01_00445 [Candidatus Micrarchaeota archaeon]
MGFEETIVGVEDRVAEMTNYLCVVIGGVLLLLSLSAMFDFTYRSMSYAMLAAGFLLFPMAANMVFKKETFMQSPPPIMKKKK